MNNFYIHFARSDTVAFDNMHQRIRKIARVMKYDYDEKRVYFGTDLTLDELEPIAKMEGVLELGHF